MNPYATFLFCKKKYSFLNLRYALVFVFSCSLFFEGFNQEKSTLPISDFIPSTAIKKPKKAKRDWSNHNPRKAILRSAILPGWGQAYNKDYWQIPIVYGLLAIPASTYIYNNTWYNRTKTAYQLAYIASSSGATNQDTLNLAQMDPRLQHLSLSSLQNYRNLFRKNRDLSVFWFLFAWGLNVVDAAVFGHLKKFDVSDNLSMELTPIYDPIYQSKGLKLNFEIKKPVAQRRHLPL